MECPECRLDSRGGVTVYERGGTKFEIECPACSTKIPLGTKTCGECGHGLIKHAGAANKGPANVLDVALYVVKNQEQFN